MRKFIVFLAFMLCAMPLCASGPINNDSDNVRDTVFDDVYVKDSLHVVDGLSVAGPYSGEQRISIPLAGVTTNGAPIGADGTTAPGMATTDGIPAVVWADNEVTPVEFSFRLHPGMESDGWAIRLLGSSSSATTPPEIDWQLFFQNDDVGFDSTATAQTAVSFSGTYTLSNEEISLTPDATAQAASIAGTTVTVNIWPTTTGSGTFELKNIEIYKP